MQAELKQWVFLPAPRGLDPLGNRPKMTRVPSGVFQKFPAMVKGEGKPTLTGYGVKMPTRYMVKINGRWRRVYCANFGNSGTLYIGKPGDWEFTVESIDGVAT